MAMKRIKGFTLVEMLVTVSLLSVVTGGLFTFAYMSSRMISRNLATNHSHEATRISSLSMLNELKGAASAFRLINADTYEDIVVNRGKDMDDLTGEVISTRSNGVRFRRLLGGPFRLSADATAQSTKLTFDFGALQPAAGDKLVIPLIGHEFDIVATSGSTVTLNEVLGYTLKTASPNFVTGYVYRRAAFTVAGNELRYHDNFNGTSKGSYSVVRTGITSPSPFSLLFPTDKYSTSDNLSLRVSMEFTDLDYSARKFASGTTTLHTVYSPRTQPTPVSSAN